MTQEERQLLLKDLCARLPYGVKFKADNEKCIREIYYIKDEDIYIREYRNLPYWIDTIKPYLRPMSSMTKEEFDNLKEFSGLKYEQLDLASYPNNYKCLDFYLTEVPSDVVILVFDWLNAHHFDYRGLIEKGFAIEASEGIY